MPDRNPTERNIMRELHPAALRGGGGKGAGNPGRGGGGRGE
jgi:hypothetical protein